MDFTAGRARPFLAAAHGLRSVPVMQLAESAADPNDRYGPVVVTHTGERH